MTYKYAVFGNPVAHSLSPRIHQQFGKFLNLDIEYTAIQADPDSLTRKLSAFKQAGGSGANITLPHKQTVINQCQSLSDNAQKAQAVNTLVATTDGWHGDNTDGAGLLWDLRRQKVQLNDARILILGAGGASRGILPALTSARPKSIMLANRTLANAQHLAADFNHIDVIPMQKLDSLKSIDVLINTTAAGHTETGFTLALDPHNQPFCYDLSYGKPAQGFAGWAKQYAYPHSDGLGMLVGQAALSFTTWTEQDVNDSIRNHVLQQLR